LAFLLCTPAALADPLPQPLSHLDFISFDMEQARIGHQLFYDPILSGNRNITCAHCHHPDFGTSDGLSLGIGEGGMGLGPDRTPGQGRDRVRKRIPRNAPALWNLGARELHTLFHDGRLTKSDLYGNGFNSPAEEWLPQGLNSILAAQALFPLTAQFEMAGNVAENEIIGAVTDRIDLGWPILAKRVRTQPEYGAAFVAAFDHIQTPEEVTIVEIANALAAFMALEWQSIDSPFDRYLAGDHTALNADQKAGMDLFYGKAQCSTCHSGSLLSDQKFHALSLPAFGPGRTRRFDPYARDVGHMGESDALEDAYRFRTPMLRNIALSGPYGHNGAYATLEGMIRHHLNPQAAKVLWTKEDAGLPDIPWLAGADFVIQSDRIEMARHSAKIDITPIALTDQEVAQLVTFMHALTGQSLDRPLFGVPKGFTP
jgi:cytochrome c peroxidase